MANDLFSTPEHALFRETVRKFVEEELRPRAREFDAAGRFDKSLYKKMGDLGMLGLRYDPKWGGAGLDYSYMAILFEEIGRCDNAGVAMGISVHTDMATPSLHQFGSDELKRRFLVPAIAGEMVSAIAVTEPDAGSDVSRIKTCAERSGDEWLINGSKIYITAARELIYACIRELNRGVDATQRITMAKLFCGRVSRQVADECIQLHGGYGYMKESVAGRAFVDSRLISIGGGSDETMIHYLAKQLGF
jgi:alkylation response protein AidB-like acyl-CoA dehydrogenase